MPQALPLGGVSHLLHVHVPLCVADRPAKQAASVKTLLPKVQAHNSVKTSQPAHDLSTQQPRNSDNALWYRPLKT